MGVLVGSDGDMFGVEAALRIGPAIGIDLVSDLEPANPRTDFHNHTGAMGAEDEWKLRLFAGIPAGPNGGIPWADTCRVEFDQHFRGGRASALAAHRR